MKCSVALEKKDSVPVAASLSDSFASRTLPLFDVHDKLLGRPILSNYGAHQFTPNRQLQHGHVATYSGELLRAASSACFSQ